MSGKTIGYILLIVGLVLLALSVFADSLGLGVTARFGWKQITGSVIGVVAVIAGVLLALRKSA